jgi:hypothetical protein
VLVTALRDVFDSIEGELRSYSPARDRFRERDRRGREIHLQGPQIEIRREAVRAAPIVPRPPSGAIGPDGLVGIGEGASGPKDPGEPGR